MQHAFDFRPYFLPYDESVYGVAVRNGFSARGSFSIEPTYDGGVWQFSGQEYEVKATPDYIFQPEDDPSGRDGDYLRIPPTVIADFDYTRCKPGVYVGAGPRARLGVRPPRGTWAAQPHGLSDEDVLNSPVGFNPYGSAPPFIALDGRKWHEIRDPDFGNVCGVNAVWARKSSFTNEYTNETMYAPYATITLSISGCQTRAGNPLP